MSGYSNPYNYGQSSLSPNPPSSGTYQVNINRTKTRKWVEAKSQNYDGDDWGADEFEDEEDEAPPPPPQPVSRVTTGLRPVAQRLPSEIQRPSERLDLGPLRSASGPPALHIQTQPFAAPPDQSFSPSAETQPSRSLSRPSVGSPLARDQAVPQFSVFGTGRTASPSNIPTNLPPRESNTWPQNAPTDAQFSRADSSQNAIESTFPSPQLSGANQTPNENVGDSRPNEQEPQPNGGQALASASDIDRKRLSVSPQLPDVARMSVFGSDIFTPSASFSNASLSPGANGGPPQPAGMGETLQGAGNGLRGVVSSESINTPAQPGRLSFGVDDAAKKGGSGEVSPISEHDNPADVSIPRDSRLSIADSQSIPPLRTPSPHATQVTGEALVRPPVLGPAPATSGHEITPTEPLQPRQPEHSPVEFEPRQFQRESTMTTVNSSPVKESDVLSEEILRSLGPAGTTITAASPVENQNTLAPGDRDTVRESSYTLSDYDNYWADATEKAGPEGRKESIAPAGAGADSARSPIKEAPRLSPKPQDAESPSQSPQEIDASQSPFDLRRRFSWEMALEANSNPGPGDGPAADPSQGTIVPDLRSPSPGQTDLLPQGDVVPAVTGAQSEQPRSLDSPSIVLPPSGGVSHQVSKASTAQPPAQQSPMLEPPSPISVVSDQNAAQIHDSNRLSIADEKALVLTSSNPASPTPPPEGHPALATTPPSKGQTADGLTEGQLMSFKDIMGMPSAADRIAKYEETRKAFSTIDSGLEEWLSNLKDQHPEYATATSSFNGGATANAGPRAPSSAGSQPSSQQPYYQQYLNASSPTSSAPPAGRSRLGGLPISSHGASSSFGNSNQIGTKSKEFMHSAGKMGKGLLSKGKSKLRGTGDKGESIPSPVQSRPKADRRMSWGLSLGARSRTVRPASHSNQEMIADTPAPPLTRTFPSDPTSGANQNSPARAIREPQGLGAPEKIGHRGGSLDADHAPYLPTPIDQDQSTWDPFAGTFLAQKEGVVAGDGGGAALVTQDLAKASTTTTLNGERSSDEWVMISSQQSGEHVQLGPSGEAAPLKSECSTQRPSPHAHRKSEPILFSMQQGKQKENDAPKRNSSFVGLPPIRRGSTFGGPSFVLSPNAIRPTEERFSFDEEDEDRGQQEEHSGADLNDPPSDQSVQSSVEPGYTLASRQDDTTPQPGRLDNNVASQQGVHQSKQVKDQSHPGHANAGVNLPKFGVPPTMQSTQTGNPIQHLPPSGPWKLEESHLTEPLHSVSRNRPGTSGSQQQLYSYDKETGVSFPMSPSPATPQFQQRYKNSDIPPSSAQRYPDLFRPVNQQRPRSNSKPSTTQSPQINRGRGSTDSSIPRAGSIDSTASGVIPVTDEGSHLKRGSGLFKDLGNRFARVTSMETRDAPAEPKSIPMDVKEQYIYMKGDETSESSVTSEEPQQGERRKSNFMLGLRPRASSDGLLQQSRGSEVIQNSPEPNETTPTTPHERKHSLLGSGGGGNFKKPSAISRSSTSSIANESNVAGDFVTSPKKRFSGFTGRSGVSGIFNRSSQNNSPKPGTSHSMTSNPVPPRSPLGFGPQGVQPQSTRRSSTPGPVPIDHPGAASSPAPSERRRRRDSAANFLSGFLGHHSTKSEGEDRALQISSPTGFEKQESGNPLLPNVQTRYRSPSTGASLNESGLVPDDLAHRRLALSSHPVQHVRPSPLGQGPPMTQRESPVARGLSDSQQVKGTSSPRPMTTSPHFFPSSGPQGHASPQPFGAGSSTSSRRHHSPRGDSITGLNEQIARELGAQGTPPPSQFSRAPTSQQSTPRPSLTAHSPPVFAQRPGQIDQTSYQPQPQVRMPSSFQEQQYPSQYVPRPPSQASAQHARFSLQSSRTPGPQVPPKDTVQLLGPVQGGTTESRSGTPSSRWKDLKNRVTGQIAHISQQSLGKTEGGEKGSTGRLLGAFKRNSKLQEPQKPRIFSGTTQPVDNNQHLPYGHPSFNRAHPPVGQPPLVQDQSQPQPQSLQQSPPLGATQGPTWMGYPQSGQDHAAQLVGVSQGRSANLRSMYNQQQPAHHVPQSYPQHPPQLPGARHFSPPPPPLQKQQHYRPPPLDQGHVEPQYDQVPIPHGYRAVRSEGVSVPSQYNMKPQAHQAPTLHDDGMTQQVHPQNIQPASLSMLRHSSMPLQGMTQHPQFIDVHTRRASEGPGQVTSQGLVSPVYSHDQVDDHDWPRPGMARVVSDESFHGSAANSIRGLNPGSPQDLKPISPQSHVMPVVGRGLLQPQAHQSNDVSDGSPRHATDVGPVSGGMVIKASSQDQEPPFGSEGKKDVESIMEGGGARVTPSAVGTGEAEQSGHAKHSATRKMVVDVDKAQADADDDIYDATPRVVVPAMTGDSNAQSEMSRMASEKAAVELEDTEGARKRKLRLEAQEEKIFYDPEQDSDGEYAPQMSATSYPGQEWNPYGVPEFGEWNERDD